jgi:hypothetical protein
LADVLLFIIKPWFFNLIHWFVIYIWICQVIWNTWALYHHMVIDPFWGFAWIFHGVWEVIELFLPFVQASMSIANIQANFMAFRYFNFIGELLIFILVAYINWNRIFTTFMGHLTLFFLFECGLHLEMNCTLIFTCLGC